ncbi:hypothetical protein B0H13DRAFT_1911308 [Mycena leptocephala]|nr:hypothetical protein B0H13DRAFT_1911308 [Mycena leptocephala]
MQMQEAIEERYTKKVKKTRRPTECAGDPLKGGTFREYAGWGTECAACELNVPGVRMYVRAGFGLSRWKLKMLVTVALLFDTLSIVGNCICVYLRLGLEVSVSPGYQNHLSPLMAYWMLAGDLDYLEYIHWQPSLSRYMASPPACLLFVSGFSGRPILALSAQFRQILFILGSVLWADWWLYTLEKAGWLYTFEWISETRHTANLFMSQQKARRDVAFSDIPGFCLVRAFNSIWGNDISPILARDRRISRVVKETPKNQFPGPTQWAPAASGSTTQWA